MKKGRGFSLHPFLFNKLEGPSALAKRRGTFGYSSIVENFGHLRLRGFVGSSFLGFFNFLVAMLGDSSVFFGPSCPGRRRIISIYRAHVPCEFGLGYLPCRLPGGCRIKARVDENNRALY
jgi:hypothetical protein